jgi:hypothetical protein
MAKANQRSWAKHRTHAAEEEYKIPFKMRRHKKDKWTDRKKYLRIIKENSKI